MPLYEFTCEECGKPFETLVRSASAVSEVICPNCESSYVRKRLSKIAVRISGGSSLSFGSSSSAGCNTGST